MFIPFVKKMKLNVDQQKVVLIGDNLSSHFTAEVLSACRDNNILCVCVPLNSTHLTQPLDVAFYGPLKKYWRPILDTWKKKVNKKSQTVTKECFPSLLKKLYCQVASDDNSRNLVSGFRKCGIYPLDRLQVIDRLPQKKSMLAQTLEETVQMVSESVIDMLKELRPDLSKKPRMKKSKVNVAPGKSIQYEDLIEPGGLSESEAGSDDEALYAFNSDIDDNDVCEEDDKKIGYAVLVDTPCVNDFVVVKLSTSKVKNEKFAVAKIVKISDDAFSVKNVYKNS